VSVVIGVLLAITNENGFVVSKDVSLTGIPAARGATVIT